MEFSTLALVVGIIGIVFFFATLSNRNEPSKSGDQSAACDSSTTPSNAEVLGPSEETPLRAAPGDSASILTNQTASEALKRPIFIDVSGSNVLREECKKGEWSKVRVIDQPSITSTYVGWIRTDKLRAVKKDAEGFKIYEAADFAWDKQTAKYKNTIVDGVNHVHRNVAICKELSTSNFGISASKSTPDDTVFYVSCGTGNAMTNVYFSTDSMIEKLKDVESTTPSGRSDVRPEVRKEAVDACARSARARIERKETFKFSTSNDDLKVLAERDSSIRVESLFSVKDKNDVDVVFEIQCVTEKGEVLESAFKKTQRAVSN